MTQPWDKEYRYSSSRISFRRAIKRKIKTGTFAMVLVAACYLAVAKHSVNSNNSVNQ